MVGLNVQNRDSLPAIFICPQCSLVLLDPVQLVDCGHRMCQSCADEQSGDVIVCATCRQRVPRVEVKPDRGFRNDMQRSIVTCVFCDWTDKLKKYPEHLQKVHPNPSCGYCEGQFPSVDALNRHQQYDCQSITIDCPLKSFGCQGAIRRVQLNEHFRNEEHHLVLIDIVRRWKSIVQHEDEAACTTTSHHSAEHDAEQLAEMQDMSNALSDSVTALADDLRRVSTEAAQHQTAVHRFPADLTDLKTSIEGGNARLDGMVIIQETTQHDLESIQEKITHISNVSCDGTLIWKIDDISTKIADAQAGKQTFIYSPAFFTCLTGYKMCLRLCMNGDGNARGTHLSLFLILMRGDYDAILKFPFLFKVIFCLYDSTEQKNHIVETLRPDPASSGFQRPLAEMNPPSGILKFAPLARVLQENSPYIRENTMFIKAMVDFNDTPKALLSYALDLNPGLTNSIQQAMLRQKAEEKQ